MRTSQLPPDRILLTTVIGLNRIQIISQADAERVAAHDQTNQSRQSMSDRMLTDGALRFPRTAATRNCGQMASRRLHRPDAEERCQGLRQAIRTSTSIAVWRDHVDG